MPYSLALELESSTARNLPRLHLVPTGFLQDLGCDGAVVGIGGVESFAGLRSATCRPRGRALRLALLQVIEVRDVSAQVREFALGVPILPEPDSPKANQIRAFRSGATPRPEPAPNLIRQFPAHRVAGDFQADPGPLAPNLIRRRQARCVTGDLQAEPGSRVSNRRNA